MTQYILILTAVLICFTSANAQRESKIKGNGEMTTENRSIPVYDKVNLLGPINVEFVRGAVGHLIVEAESNFQQYIISEVDGGTLDISVKKNITLRPSGSYGIKITVPFQDLKALSLRGSGNMWNSDVIKASSFETKLTGSGDIKLNLEVGDLYSKITGPGNTHLKGSAMNFECKVTGSGDFKAYELEAQEIKATVLGSGDIQVNASESLLARVMGSGDIFFRGNPAKEDLKASGSGSISSK